MKKIVFLMAAIACLAFVSCSKGDGEEVPPKEVSFTLSVAFPESGSMARASAADLYGEFYNSYIVTKELVPKTFSLSISKDGTNIGDISGEWDADMITLPTGTYKIWGKSEGDMKIASLTFSQDVVITEETKNITLTAAYDCYMLMFDKEKFSRVSLSHQSNSGASTSTTLPSTEKIHYVFLPYQSAKSISYGANGDAGYILLSAYHFENGKYYAFDLTSGSFTIPEMQPATAE